MKTSINRASGLKEAALVAKLSDPSIKIEEGVPRPPKPDCMLHSFFERAMDLGYPAIEILGSYHDDAYLPFALEAMHKCGHCFACELLGDDPLRSQMIDLVATYNPNPRTFIVLADDDFDPPVSADGKPEAIH